MVSPKTEWMPAAAGVLSFLVCTLLATPGVEAKGSKRSSVLSGVVLTMQDEPLAGVAVKFESTEDGAVASTATTDPKGEFSIELAAGEYVLRLARDGFVPFEGPVSVLENQQLSMRLQMLDASMGRRNVAIRAYNAGVLAFESGDSAAAILHLEESEAADPTFAEPLSLMADIHFAQGSFAESAAAAERCLKLEADDRETQALAYRAYRKAGDQAKVDEWRAVLAKNGAAKQMSIDAYNEGVQANAAGDVDTTAERFRVALELNPELAEAHSGLASIQFNQGRYEDALAAVERALALKPEDASSLRVLFLIHNATGNRAAADAAIAAYAEVDPAGAVELIFRRADLDFHAGNHEDAETALLELLKIEPDHAHAHRLLGLIYARDDPAKAREYLERFIALAPAAPEVASAKQLMATF